MSRDCLPSCLGQQDNGPASGDVEFETRMGQRELRPDRSGWVDEDGLEVTVATYESMATTKGQARIAFLVPNYDLRVRFWGEGMVGNIVTRSSLKPKCGQSV